MPSIFSSKSRRFTDGDSTTSTYANQSSANSSPGTARMPTPQGPRGAAMPPVAPTYTVGSPESAPLHKAAAPAPKPAAPKTLLDQTPESVVAASLKMKGELHFNRLLRVDGRFEGTLITSKGSLVVGPQGEVVGDLKNMKEVHVEGIVRGNVSADIVKIKNKGVMLGDIHAKSLTLDPTACIKGVADTYTTKDKPDGSGPPVVPALNGEDTKSP